MRTEKDLSPEITGLMNGEGAAESDKGILASKGSVVDQILEGSREIWTKFHDHPFVAGIADGTLPKEKFEYFMIQDYLYLLEYAKVFSIGAAKAKNTQVAKAFSAYVDQIMGGELMIHRSYMERLGIDLATADAAYRAQDNLSYSSYMLRCAYEGGPAEVCAAILPCAISYEEIGREIVRRNPASVDHPFYGEWIIGYSAEDYHEANEELKKLTEMAAADYNDAQIAELIEIGKRCSRYEGMFWDMSWDMRR